MQKFLFSLFVVTFAILFSFTFVFANDSSMLNDAANTVRDTVGGAENAVEDAAKDVSNASKDATGDVENMGQNTTTDNNMKNNDKNDGSKNTALMTRSNDNNDGGYTATRTSTTGTTDDTFLGMNSTYWIWLILGIAAIAIIAMVYYYSTQVNSNNYDDNE